MLHRCQGDVPDCEPGDGMCPPTTSTATTTTTTTTTSAIATTATAIATTGGSGGGQSLTTTAPSLAPSATTQALEDARGPYASTQGSDPDAPTASRPASGAGTSTAAAATSGDSSGGSGGTIIIVVVVVVLLLLAAAVAAVFLLAKRRGADGGAEEGNGAGLAYSRRQVTENPAFVGTDTLPRHRRGDLAASGGGHPSYDGVLTTPGTTPEYASAGDPRNGGGGHPSYDGVLTTPGTTPEYASAGDPRGGGALSRGASAAAAVNGDVDGGGYVTGLAPAG